MVNSRQKQRKEAKRKQSSSQNLSSHTSSQTSSASWARSKRGSKSDAVKLTLRIPKPRPTGGVFSLKEGVSQEEAAQVESSCATPGQSEKQSNRMILPEPELTSGLDVQSAAESLLSLGGSREGTGRTGPGSQTSSVEGVGSEQGSIIDDSNNDGSSSPDTEEVDEDSNDIDTSSRESTICMSLAITSKALSYC